MSNPGGGVILKGRNLDRYGTTIAMENNSTKKQKQFVKSSFRNGTSNLKQEIHWEKKQERNCNERILQVKRRRILRRGGFFLLAKREQELQIHGENASIREIRRKPTRKDAINRNGEKFFNPNFAHMLKGERGVQIRADNKETWQKITSQSQRGRIL